MLSVLPRLPTVGIRARSLARARTAPDGTPTWLSNLGLAVGEWGEITGTNLSSVDPSPTPAGSTGPASKIIAWNSFAVARAASKVYSVANGGHTDYAGNEVNVIDFSQDTPVWSQLLAPTAAGSVTTAADYYSDGRPASRHTAYGVAVDEINGRIMLMGGSRYQDGASVIATSSFDIASGDYTASGTHPNLPANVRQEVCGTCVNPLTGDIYRNDTWEIQRWNASSNTWTLIRDEPAAPSFVGNDAASAWDTSRNRMFVCGTVNSSAWTYTPGTDTLTQQTLSGAAAATIDGLSKMGMVYAAGADKFFLRPSGSGGTVYQVDPATFEATTYSTTGGASVPATTNGPYNKFLYLPNLGVIVYFPSHTGNAWALRVE